MSKYEYDIKITFSLSRVSPKKQLLESHKLSYRSSNGNTDDLEIYNNQLIIKGRRTSKIIAEDVIVKNKKTIYSQIIKSLCYYYVVNEERQDINDIKVTIIHSKKDDVVTCHGCNEIEQIYLSDNSSCFFILSKIKKDKIKLIFKDNDKLLYAITSLISSITTGNEYERFIKLWASYNSIYQYITNEKADKSALCQMTSKMTSTNIYLPFSTEFINRYGNIKDITYWGEMLNNDNGKDDILNVIDRKSDVRILELTKNSITMTKDKSKEHLMLLDEEKYNNVMKKISEKLKKNERDDNELIAFLCNKYMYFLRNIAVHGNKIDARFWLVRNSDEQQKIKWASDLLINTIIDLFNSPLINEKINN